jgi:Phosphoinositide phospholipase C, Ca2+-dependent
MKALSFAACLVMCALGPFYADGGAAHTVAAQTCTTITRDNVDDCVRLNQIQLLGTHNSYHLAPKPSVLATLGPHAPGLEYTHRTLTEQLSTLGIRQFELDVFADPQGGRYAQPRAHRLTGDAPDPAMQKPGFKVFHVQDVDVRSTCATGGHRHARVAHASAGTRQGDLRAGQHRRASRRVSAGTPVAARTDAVRDGAAGRSGLGVPQVERSAWRGRSAYSRRGCRRVSRPHARRRADDRSTEWRYDAP